MIRRLIHGIWYILTKTSIQKRILLKIGIRKVIDFGDNPEWFNVYAKTGDKYWNDLLVVTEYINKNITGYEDTTWIKDILSRFKEYLPFKKVLIVGCGNGWVERELFDLGIGLQFDSFDLSNKIINEAENRKGIRKIRYFVGDITDLELEKNSYDAVFNVSVLHHISNLSHVFKNISRMLKLTGLIFNYEYVGPNQYQFSDQHLKILNEVNKQLPKRFQNIQYNLRSSIEHFELEDKTEAIASELVYEEFKQIFDIIYEREFMGGIAYPILLNNVKEFRKEDTKSLRFLKLILDKDTEYTKSKKIPNLHLYFVGKNK
jgi:ubiquinone/menaquinone biosynthesis C-methylase UbiE|tara:strand:- start:46 stop:996 length:951 start_codon:yes stop_codon:yes gene_type:complete